MNLQRPGSGAAYCESEITPVKKRLHFGIRFYYRESRLQYLLGNPRKLGLLKLALKMLLQDFKISPISTFIFMFFCNIIRFEERHVPIQNLFGIDNEHEIWISRQAILGGLKKNRVDETIDYDFFRNAKYTKIRLWSTDETPKKLSTSLINTNKSFPSKPFNVQRFQDDSGFVLRQLTNVTIQHGTSITSKENLVPIDSSQSGSLLSWPSDKPVYYQGNCFLLTSQILCNVEKAIFVGHSQSWYHFIVEYLPRYLKVPDNERGRTIVLPKKIHHQFYEVLEMLGFSTFIALQSGDSVSVEKLLVVQDFRRFDTNYPKARSSDIQNVRDFFSSFTKSINPDEFSSCQKLLILRPHNLFRQSNLSELAAKFEERGFCVVRPEQLSAKKQILLFRSAKVIVAESGAALTSVIFCNKRTKIIEIQDSNHQDTFWAEYCDLLDLDHQKVLSTRIWGRESRSFLSVNIDEVFKHIVDP